MFKWLKNIFKGDYRYRYRIHVESFPWGFSYTFQQVHSLNDKGEIASSVTNKGTLYCSEGKYRQFSVLASNISLREIKDDNEAVSPTYGATFHRFLTEVEKFCSDKEPAIVEFYLKEELVANFTGIDRLDWMLRESHVLILRTVDGKHAREFDKEELDEILLKG